jgi:hypothetical protein
LREAVAAEVVQMTAIAQVRQLLVVVLVAIAQVVLAQLTLVAAVAVQKTQMAAMADRVLLF